MKKEVVFGKEQKVDNVALYKRYSSCMVAVGLALITVLFYLPSLSYPFQFDDLANILKYFTIRHNGFWDYCFSGTRWISYWLNTVHYKIGKFDPLSYRIGSLSIHVFSGMLLFGILYYLLQRLPRKSFFVENSFAIAMISALLFLLHPVQTQTVSYVIQGELEGLAALFSLLLIAAFLWMVEEKSTVFFVVRLMVASIVAVLSCGTKEITIIAPFLTLLVDWFFIAQGKWDSFKQRLWIHGLFLTIIGTMYMMYLKPTFFAKIFTLNYTVRNNMGNILTKEHTNEITPFMFLISEFKVIIHYIMIYVFPYGICMEYDWKIVPHLFAPDAILPLLVLILLGAVLVRSLKDNKANIWAFGPIWFFCAIAPRATIMPSPELVVDYKTYLGSPGILFFFGALLVYGARYLWQKDRFYDGISTVALVVLLGVSVVFRNHVWRTGIEFWGDVIAKAPTKARGFNNYGVELSQNLGKFIEAIPYFLKAIELDDKYPDACNNLAVAYAQIGRLDEAIASLERSIKLNPRYPEGYNNLASFLLQKKEHAKAKKALELALQLRPHYGKALYNLGRIYIEEGDKEKALQYFKDACTKADLDNEFGFSMYAQLALSMKRYEDACWASQKLLELDKGNAIAWENFAIALAGNKQYEEAFRACKEAVRRDGALVKPVRLMADLLFETNQTEDALRVYKELKASGIFDPQIEYCMAVCHEKLGRPRAAYDLLGELLEKSANEDVRKIATSCRSRLAERYKLA